MFNERTGTWFNHLQFPTDVVLLVVLWRLRYKLSLRELTEMFLLRGYVFTYETVREWEARFAPLLSVQLKSGRHRYYPMCGFSSFAGAACFCTAFDELCHYLRSHSTRQNLLSLSEQRRHFQQRVATLLQFAQFL